MQLVQLPVQYLLTLVDFLLLKRPRRFFETLSDDPTRYVHPIGFLVTNLAFAAGLTLAAARSVSPSPGEEWSEVEATMIFVVVAGFHCFLAVLLGKLAGYLLNEVTTVATLFHAFCYTSVFYLAIAPFLPSFLDMSDLQLQMRLIVGLTGLQLVAAIYLLVAMAHASSLHGRRLLAFVTLCGSAGIVVMGFVTVGVTAAISKDEDKPYTFSVCETDAERWPTAAITLPAQGHNPGVVVLMGATLGSRTEEWFALGSTIEMRSSVRAHDGVGFARDLEPNTKYYFRYVIRNGAATCYGHVETFKTDRL
jgi:hypothetical protein